MVSHMHKPTCIHAHVRTHIQIYYNYIIVVYNSIYITLQMFIAPLAGTLYRNTNEQITNFYEFHIRMILAFSAGMNFFFCLNELG